MATPEQILSGCGSSLVPLNHLQQILRFTCGAGVEFLPLNDSEGIRRRFLDRLVRDNRLRSKSRQMAAMMIRRGRVLLYLRPVGDGGYRIQHYKPDQYRADYDANGDLHSVVIIYSYKVRENGQLRDRWVRLRLTAQWITKEESDSRLEFEDSSQTVPSSPPISNSLGFLPCVEIFNPVPASEDEGLSDFSPLQAQIDSHDEMVATILENLDFFCNSPLLTSRDAGDVIEANGAASEPRGVAWASGFRDPAAAVQPFDRKRNRKKLKRVIGGLEADEMFSQLDVNPVPGDLLAFADGYERQLRESLGGILERGIETAAETSVVYGKVQATAAEKQEALFSDGLCRLLEMAIYAEEMLFVASGGTIGLPDLGDRLVRFRVAPVYIESPNQTNLRSITSRNLMKFVGVSAKEAAKYVFPGKSDAELDAMVSEGGFPSDYLSTAIAMYAQLAQTLDPSTGLPVAHPETGQPLANLLIPFIANNLNYGTQFDSSSSTPDPGDRSSALLAALASVWRLQQSQQSGLVSPDDRQSVGEDLNLPSPGSTVTPNASIPPFFDLTRSPILNAFGIGRTR
jgi:hypothetical protein